MICCKLLLFMEPFHQHGNWHVRVPWVHDLEFIVGNFLGVDLSICLEELVENHKDAKAC